MKYCENCGQQMEDNDQFCPNCGTASQDKSQDKQEQQNTQTQSNPIDQTQDKTPSSTLNMKFLKNKKIMIPIVAAIIVVVIAFVTYGQMKKRVNINDYITVEFDGYNTVGTADVDLDVEGLVSAILKAQGKTVTDSAISTFLYSEDFLYSSNKFKYSLDESTDLSNGDKVKVTITCDDSVEDSLGVNFVFKDKEYTVSDLQEPKEVDPFENVDVTFSGTSPNVSAKVNNTSSDSYLSSLSFKLSESSGIAKGDKITLDVSVDEKTALKNGYKFTTTSKDYTCDSVDEYLTDLSALSDTQLTTLKKQATDEIESYIASHNKYLSYDSLQYEGAYLLTTKTDVSYYYNSSSNLYIIYSMKITTKDSNEKVTNEDTTVYIPVLIGSVLIKKDGSVSISSSSSTIIGTTKLQYSGYSYVSGYTDGSEMYNYIITTNKNRYNYQVSGNISQFGE